MFPIVMPNVQAIARDVAANALRLPEKYRMDFIEMSLKREAREGRSLLRRIVGLEDVAFGNIEGFIEDLGATRAEAAAIEIDRQLGGAPRILDLEQVLGEVNFQTAHQSIRAFARVDELQGLANRYGAIRFDRANAEFLCDELEKLRMSLKIYKEKGWLLAVGGKVRRFDVRKAIEHLNEVFPGLCW
jgi:hypothetical protein